MDQSAGFSDVFYSAADGLKLHARSYGDAAEGVLPVVCLPGLTRNVRDFHPLALFLSSDARVRRRVVAFDYRGRGASAYDRDWKNYNIVTEANDVLAGLVAVGIEKAHVIGTSRGGLITHLIAGLRPAVLASVVLNDIGPVVEGEGLVHIRSYVEKAPKPKTVAEAVEIQRAIHGPAFPALTDADWLRFVEAIYRDERGRPVADFDPALLKVVGRFDLAKPLPTMWPQFEALARIPLLAIRGANSRLLSPATLREMASRHPDCQTVTVEGQGHAPFLETAGLPQTIEAFFERAERTS